MVRLYENTNTSWRITVYSDKNEAEINSTQLNLSGSIIGLHRLRGFGGPLLYNIYALLLDFVGIGLILFVVTGLILWLKILNHNRIAWTILLLGFLYVCTVLSYLIFM